MGASRTAALAAVTMLAVAAGTLVGLELARDRAPAPAASAAAQGSTETETTVGVGLAPIRVRLVDVDTGAVLRSGWVTCFVGPQADPRALIEPDADGCWRFGRLPGVDPRIARVSIGVKPPAGYVVPTRRVTCDHVSAFARVLAADVPLRRERILEVEVRDEAGRPVQLLDGAWVESGDRWSAGTEATETPGVWRIRDAALIPGERSTVRVWSGRGSWIGEVPDAAADGRVPRFALRRERPAPKDRRVFGCDFDFGDSVHGPRGLDPAIDTRVVVRVRTADGRPAAGVAVFLESNEVERGENWSRSRGLGSAVARADADGVAVVEHLPSGEVTIEANAAGFTLTATTVALAEHGALDVELVERPGRRVAVTVVDDEGRPVPGASVAARYGYDDFVWTACTEGVQRLELFSDACGRVVVPSIGDADCTLTASLGSRFGETRLAAGDAEATVVLVRRDDADER